MLIEYYGYEKTLQKWINNNNEENEFGQPSVAWADRKRWDFFCQAANALWELEKKGWVHRDVKSSNFMINENDQLKLIDFEMIGIINPNEPESLSTQWGTHLVGGMGSPNNLAPEMVLYSDYEYEKYLTRKAEYDSFGLGNILNELYGSYRVISDYYNLDSSRFMSKGVLGYYHETLNQKTRGLNDYQKFWQDIIQEKTKEICDKLRVDAEELGYFYDIRNSGKSKDAIERDEDSRFLELKERLLTEFFHRKRNEMDYFEIPVSDINSVFVPFDSVSVEWVI